MRLPSAAPRTRRRQSQRRIFFIRSSCTREPPLEHVLSARDMSRSIRFESVIACAFGRVNDEPGYCDA